MRLRVLALVATAVLGCVSFELDSRRFRCDESHPCTAGWVCGSDGYCTQAADEDASADASIDADIDARIDAPNLPGEICGNNIDDDGDQLIDCLDPECPTDLGCGVGCGCIGGVPTENACMD
jgi:hypothetical protein